METCLRVNLAWPVPEFYGFIEACLVAGRGWSRWCPQATDLGQQGVWTERQQRGSGRDQGWVPELESSSQARGWKPLEGSWQLLLTQLLPQGWSQVTAAPHQRCLWGNQPHPGSGHGHGALTCCWCCLCKSWNPHVVSADTPVLIKNPTRSAPHPSPLWEKRTVCYHKQTDQNRGKIKSELWGDSAGGSPAGREGSGMNLEVAGFHRRERHGLRWRRKGGKTVVRKMEVNWLSRKKVMTPWRICLKPPNHWGGEGLCWQGRSRAGLVCPHLCAP